jgi:hypothetical protein
VDSDRYYTAQYSLKPLHDSSTPDKPLLPWELSIGGCLTPFRTVPLIAE